MPYDFAVIGSGIGGLVSAAILAKEGFHVVVLEKNRQFGGALQIFSRSKRIIDTGIHYIGGLAEGQNLNRIFRYLGVFAPDDYIRMDEDCFDAVWPGGSFRLYPLAQGFDRFAAVLSEYFPREKTALKKYVITLQKVLESSPIFNLESVPSDYAENPYLRIGAADFIEETFQSEVLKRVIAGNNIIYDGRRKATSLYTHAMTMASYIQSAWRMREGGHRLVQRFVKTIHQAGGTCINYAEVDKVMPAGFGGFIVKDKQGRTFEAHKVLFSTHPYQIIKSLNPEILPRPFRRKSRLPESAAGITFHLALKPGLEDYRNYNVYGHPNGQVWDGASHNPLDHWGIYWYPDLKYPGKSSVISILTYCPDGYFERWSDTFRSQPRFRQSRGEDYEMLKMNLAEKLLASLPEPVRINRYHIDSITVSTSLTWRDYTGSPTGSMYGILKDYHQPLASLFSPVLIPERLYFTGQNLNLHGVVGTSLSALITCGSLVGLPYLLNKIRRET